MERTGNNFYIIHSYFLLMIYNFLLQAERVRKEKRLEQSDSAHHIESEDVELNLITG